MARRVLVGAVGLSLGLHAGACIVLDPHHCANTGIDCGAGMVCDRCSGINDGCVPLDQASPEPSCIMHGGASTDDTTGSGEDTTAVATTHGDPASGSTEEADASTAAPPACDEDEDCGEGGPFCLGGRCVACDAMPDSDAACAALDPNRGVCAEGTCVQCTAGKTTACVDATPVCEGTTCRACVEHDECPGSACHLDGADAGACFRVEDVVEVDSVSAIGVALQGLGTDDDRVLVLAPGTYETTVAVTGGAEVAILGVGNVAIDGGAGFGVNVSTLSIVYLKGIAIRDGNDVGLRCVGRSVWMDDVVVRNNGVAGVEIANGCDAHLRRSRVVFNPAGAIHLIDGTLAMQNSVVSLNGTPFSAVGGLDLDGGEVAITYSTLVANDSNGSYDTALCTAQVGGFVRNSILLGRDPLSLSGCTGITFSGNAVDEPVGFAGNQDVGMFESAWFVDPAAGDFQLTAAGQAALAGIAQWQEGDPLYDHAGDPIETGGPSFPGYDQP